LKEEVVCLKEEIACLHVELQRKHQRLLAACQIVVMLHETNESLIRRPPPMQQEMNSNVSSNHLHAPGSGDEALSGVRTVAETTIKIDLICKVCNSGHACMLLLPCQHLCACKPCGVRLTVCPVCSAVKGGVVEAWFVEKWRSDSSDQNMLFSDAPKGLFGKWRNQVDGRGLKGILWNFDL
jgi:E3 ubiquitin-protein ligase BOI-like protein